MQPKRLCVRDELYLLAHKETGDPRIHLPSLSLGLAAAVLIDLILTSRITIAGTHIGIRDLTPTGDAITDSSLHAMSGDDARSPSGERSLPVWLRRIGDEIHERTGAWLHMCGRLSKHTKRKLWGSGHSTYRISDTATVRWLTSLLYQVVAVNPRVDAQSAALCALAAKLRLEGLSGANVPTTQLLYRLSYAIDLHPDPVSNQIRAVADTVEELVAAQAVSVYR